MTMVDALIGYSGFVGSVLLKQRNFEARYRSTNINEINGESFGMVLCAGAPAEKWIANRQSEVDWQKIEGLIKWLATIRCNTFVLISTVDVFKTPLGVNEQTPVEENGLHAYGLHRRRLERFVETQFPNHLIVRLPGLVGPGLRKNVIYDFLNDNNLHAIDSRGVFQFYPMVSLWFDIEIALRARLKLVHLTAEPVSVAEISAQGFGRTFDHVPPGNAARYDVQSAHAAAFGASGAYQYSRRETIQAVRAYAQSEPVTIRKAQGAST